MVTPGILLRMALPVVLSLSSLHRSAPQARVTSPCAADPNYQRLAFWVGDWEVLDSAGAHYASQRVRTVVDACAITAEWTGRAGDKGFNLSAYDGRSGEWRQTYVSNQVPVPLAVTLRRSDPSYEGPGVRFIPLFPPPAGTTSLARITILPLAGGHVMQLFENSRDAGATWSVTFRAEHRPSPSSGER